MACCGKRRQIIEMHRKRRIAAKKMKKLKKLRRLEMLRLQEQKEQENNDTTEYGKV